MAAAGALALPAVAQASPLLPLPLAPPCAAYQFPGGRVEINYQAINGQTTFDTVNASTTVDTTAVTHYPDGGDTSGPVTGYIHGVGIHLEVGRGKYQPLILDGLVGPDNRAHGTLKFNGDKQNWDSNTEFSCVANPQPEPVGPAPNKVDTPAPQQSGPQPLVPDQGAKPLGSATVIADTDIYDKPDGQGQKIGTLTVGETHPLMEPCRNDWCRVGGIELGGFPGLPNGTAWVYSKGFLTFS
ncbi:hypothetical protein DVS77_09595 [Mycolicibacterium moriokaense]|nr:hypothetical protein DVS77_09595 [Mycolicibacterium moriokaense]